jgi:hypothetical protein
MKFNNTFITALACLLFTPILHAQTPCNPDINKDGTLNILVIGTNKSIKDGAEAFSSDQITKELQSILSADTSISIHVNVVAENIYQTKNFTSGIAGTQTRNLDYFSHSLVQYYYWPDGHVARMNKLTGNDGVDWDLVVIGADPYIVSKIPGYYSLGVNKIAAKVMEGGAKPLLLMMWSKDESLINHFEEFTYRASDGAKVKLETVPAGLAWKALPAGKKDIATAHPTPNGAYLAAASIYSHLYNKSASSSQYAYDDVIADNAHTSRVSEASKIHYVGKRSFISPYKSCEIKDSNLIYNHGGTSTENGILDGLQWVITQDQKTLQYGATAPIHFNYGRSSMGSTHLYDIDPSKYDYSFGYPLQDDKSTGEVSMLYGIDKRVTQNDVETDLGVALYMVRNSEIPYGRNVPLRTIIAQMLEGIPGIEIYSDNWHLSGDVNNALGTFMFTLLSGDCALEGDTIPSDSTEWRTWMAHKIGYETAWNVMHLEGISPCYKVPKDSLSPCDKTTSIATHTIDAISVYPNPTKGGLSIDLGANYNAISVTLTDLTGKILQSEHFNEGSLLDLKIEEPAGVYLLLVELGGEKSIIRLLKE